MNKNTYLRLALFYMLISLLFIVYWYREVNAQKGLDHFYAEDVRKETDEELSESRIEEGFAQI